ncbi:DUF3859 domain-containing protein [Stieleria sp. ICT_E10.1]|uniref:DUF3859 domain-containing protein n=1 Tax=Stieleria sedimenti TaxID=2976331 RepID=UPI00217F2B57|nr:DUF3859 domain-containing protein [Stieleria sedimenti]MCS7468308.1 DUF3859 domain-containing protein [Stieleria sedimenti]
MAKQRPEVSVRTYGLYSKWDSGSKELPAFLESTTRIPAEVDVEFGLVINVIGGKNLQLHYCIDHPGIRDAEGKRRPPFEDVVYVKTNDWDFYLGDTVWEPIDDKIGTWRMTLTLSGQIVADQRFEVYRPANKRRVVRPMRHQYRLVWIPGL